MSAFLAHLAGIALGAPGKGAARLSLPPRFAPPAASDAWPEGLAIEEAFGGEPPAAPAAAEPRRRSDALAPDAVPIQAAAAPAPKPAAARAPKSATPVPKSAAPAPKSAAPAPKSAAPAGEASGPPHAAGRPRRAAALQPAAPPPVIDRVAIQSPIAAPASHVSRSRADAPLLPPALAPALPAEARIDAARPDSKARVLPRPAPPPAAARERPFAPLSERALAGRTERSHQAEPVIHVTIDRIDVRAPAAARPAPAARRRPAEPSVSLADFLRGGPRTSQ